MTSYVLLPDEKMNKEELVENDEFMNHTRNFLLKRNNEVHATDDETFEAYLDHMRRSVVGDVTPLGDYQYAQDATEQDRSEYAGIQNVFDRYTGSEDFLSVKTLDKIADYVGPVLNPLESPSTAAGLFTGGTGAVAAKLGAQGVKIGLKKLLALSLRDSLKTVAVEGGTGALVGAARGETQRLLGDKESNWKTGAVYEGALRGAGGLVSGGVMGYFASKKGARLGTNVLAKSEEAEAKFAAAAKEQTEEILKKEDPHAYIKGATDTVDDTETKFFADKLRELDEDLVAKGIDVKGGLGPEGLDEALVAGLSRETVNAVVAAGKEIAKTVGWTSTIKNADGVVEDNSTRITERVAKAIQNGTVTDANGKEIEFSIDVLDGIADRFNLTREDIGALWAAEVSEAARTLRGAGLIKQATKEGDKSPFRVTDEQKLRDKEISTLISFVNDRMGSSATTELVEQINRVSQMGNTARKFFNQEIGGTLMGLNKLRLGLMTSKMATTIRNAANVGIRLPMHMIEYVGTGGSIVDAAKIPFELLFDRTEANVLAIAFEKANSKQFKQIFRDAMDIEQNAGLGYVGNKLTALGRKVNAHNTFVDNTVKKSVLLGEFRKIAKAEGKDLFDDVIAKGELKKFLIKNRKQVEDGMAETLSLVYQKGYKKDSFAGQFIQFTAQSKNSLWTSLVIPFPRYLANQTEFIYKHTPVLAAIAPLTKKYAFGVGTDTVKKGRRAGQLTQEAVDFNKDFKKRMYQQLSGFGLMYTAMQFKIGQGPEMAWNEMANSEGQVFDLTALLGPFASTFFAVDMWYRSVEGQISLPMIPNTVENNKVKVAPISSSKEIVRSGLQAFAGIQARTGTGLHFLDSLIDTVMTDKNALLSEDETIGGGLPAWQRIITKVAADWVNTFTIPVGMFTELQGTFDPEGRKIMDNDRLDLSEYFWNYALRSLPNTEALRNTGRFLAPEGSKIYEAYASEDSLDSFKNSGGFSNFIEGLRGEQVEQRFPVGSTRTRLTPFVRELTGISNRYDFRGKPLIEREATRLGVSRDHLTPRDKNPLIERRKKTEMDRESGQVVATIRGYADTDPDDQKIQLQQALKAAKSRAIEKANRTLSGPEQQAKARDRFNSLDPSLRKKVIEQYNTDGKNLVTDEVSDWVRAMEISKLVVDKARGYNR